MSGVVRLSLFSASSYRIGISPLTIQLLKITMVTNTGNTNHQELVGFIWSIADKLRGPYRPPQYRRVMLPLIVLRRLDAVLEPSKKIVIDSKAKYEAMGLKDKALEKAIAKDVKDYIEKETGIKLSLIHI